MSRFAVNALWSSVGATEQEELARRWTDREVDQAIRERVEAGASVRDLSTELAEHSGRSRRDLYTRAVALRDEGSESS